MSALPHLSTLCQKDIVAFAFTASPFVFLGARIYCFFRKCGISSSRSVYFLVVSEILNS